MVNPRFLQTAERWMNEELPANGSMNMESTTGITLDIKSLTRDYRPGITQTIGSYMAEAIVVCLDSQNHKSNAVLTVKGSFHGKYTLDFEPATDRMRRGHNDAEVATENGAYGISILLIDFNTDLTVIERSRKGTGFDYWLGLKTSPAPYFQQKARLEVSGIRHGTDGAVDSRVKTKLEQTRRSDGSLPAYVAVIEFGSPKAKVVEK